MHVSDTSKDVFEENVAQSGFPPLQRDMVHVWSVGLADKNVEESLSCLSEDERERALKLSPWANSANFIVTRSTLRLLLANYLNMQACDIHIEYGPKGKPHVVSGWNIQFSVSHSRTQAMVAVSKERRVGIDLEWRDPSVDVIGLAERFFLPEETTLLRLLNKTERLDSFYRMWTRKESTIKARGEGLGQLSSSASSLALCEGLRIFDLQAPVDFAAALSVEILPGDVEVQLQPLTWPLVD